MREERETRKDSGEEPNLTKMGGRMRNVKSKIGGEERGEKKMGIQVAGRDIREKRSGAPRERREGSNSTNMKG